MTGVTGVKPPLLVKLARLPSPALKGVIAPEWGIVLLRWWVAGRCKGVSLDRGDATVLTEGLPRGGKPDAFSDGTEGKDRSVSPRTRELFEDEFAGPGSISITKS